IGRRLNPEFMGNGWRCKYTKNEGENAHENFLFCWCKGGFSAGLVKRDAALDHNSVNGAGT
ncbi:MAG: hypothetical protein AAFP98_01925, partial [Pseudomonadota bacterium]